MNDEMKFMSDNDVWELVELLSRSKMIGCKWVFKIKHDSKGKVERHKIRLVVKGFTQKDLLRIILEFVAHYNLKLHKMDVKTTFLNEDLEEAVYVNQPEGFSIQGKEKNTLVKCIYLKVSENKIIFLILNVYYNFTFVGTGLIYFHLTCVGVPEHLMHKNRLQEYTQRSAIPLPAYQTMNEGSPHAPRFRANVLVDGVTYVSSETFSHRKEAEQAVAKYALEYILEKIKNEGCPLLSEDTIFCKSILNEYAVKMNLEKPSYETTQSKGLLPVFVSSLSFNGKLYTGSAGKNKKEAEQLAARAVIQSILGESHSGSCLSEIIKSKGKLYAAMHKIKDSGTSTSIKREVGVLPGTDTLPMPAYAGTSQGQQDTSPVSISEAHGRELKKPRLEPLSETSTDCFLTSLPVPHAHQPHPNQVQNEVPLEQPCAIIVSGSSQGAVVVENEVPLAQLSAVGGSSQGTVGTTDGVKCSRKKNKRVGE
ncbi:uncharacterized protein LOC122650915 [Telopea speciosissima]|uniref:uncharacterized protein LOC122650915 n=1 Tax=Telopea speciosissima TaxID=54955 RepID=UPI001CC5A01D|nr:uncharacterized protein LOC122650915 [Telopea speciosissima]